MRINTLFLSQNLSFDGHSCAAYVSHSNLSAMKTTEELQEKKALPENEVLRFPSVEAKELPMPTSLH